MIHLFYSMNISTAVYSATSVFLTYVSFLFVYRITLHPLARFPGPKLAALTYWYEFYYDVIGSGRFLFKIQELHEQYGPVLRVNPNEIHINDPDFYSEIYQAKSYKVDRDAFYTVGFLAGATPATQSHDDHARRRQSLTNYFSMRSIRLIEDRITSIISTMGDRLQQAKEAGTIINSVQVFSALGADVASEYFLGKAGSMDLMSHPEFAKMWTDMGKAQIPSIPFSRHFKFVMKTFLLMPVWMAERLTPFLSRFIQWQKEIVKIIAAAYNKHSGSVDAKATQGITILDDLIASPDLIAEDKTPSRLRNEMTLLVGAGTETTATTLSRTVFHVLSDPQILQRLKTELKIAAPNPQDILQLDVVWNLPYLNAVIEEGLRISTPVIGRSPRVFQDHSLRYRDWVIPAKSAVSQSIYFVSMNSDIFSEPHTFRPDRWLDNPGLQKYQVTFSKGRRMCIGINLAYAELRLGLAYIFRRFELELYETTRKDVDIVHDFLVGWPAYDSRGVRIKVVGELE